MSLILYRGDFLKIDEFKTSKTNNGCLLGMGIYLTDSIKIAKTYKTKNQVFRYCPIVLFNGKCDSRLVAREVGFNVFFKEYCREEGIVTNPKKLTKKQLENLTKEIKEIYKRKIDRKEIVDEYVDKSTVKVTWIRSNDSVGNLTVFDFSDKYITNNVLHVDRPCNDVEFWTLMFNHKVPIGKPAEYLHFYLHLNVGKTIFNAVEQRNEIDKRLHNYKTRYKNNVWNKIQKVVEPYGIIGFEYNGGIRLGGSYFHRAFCIWDDELVNRHKIE